jgi:hypothetical protein
MSSFNITDITIAGAYTNAIAAAQDSSRRNARRHPEPSQGPDRPRLLSRLARRVAAALSERRPVLRPAPRRA